VTEIDLAFARARGGDERGFAKWVGRVERPIRASLEPYARAVDVEGVVQETLLRMWVLARDGDRELTGENASLRFAIGMARNIARNEARRLKREVHLPEGEPPEFPVPPDPPPDPGLRRAIVECLQELAGQPRRALHAVLEHGHRLANHALAAMLGMTPNTFLQNVTRARRQVAACLEGKGLDLKEILS
jgi:RNA polymerase sigma-70 factor (ECF subfamily)